MEAAKIQDIRFYPSKRNFFIRFNFREDSLAVSKQIKQKGQYFNNGPWYQKRSQRLKSKVKFIFHVPAG